MAPKPKTKAKTIDEYLAALSDDKRAALAALFTCGTLREAYLKARGEGLRRPLHRFEVTWTLGENGLTDADDPEAGAIWRLRPLRVDADYAAARAVRAHRFRIRYRRWAEDRSLYAPRHRPASPPSYISITEYGGQNFAFPALASWTARDGERLPGYSDPGSIQGPRP